MRHILVEVGKIIASVKNSDVPISTGRCGSIYEWSVRIGRATTLLKSIVFHLFRWTVAIMPDTNSVVGGTSAPRQGQKDYSLSKAQPQGR
ncbi:hypothetical protein GQ600_7111 [Phytophthora cactorum]|nr:hypothetical protein GQ600_7111 [Phytophthora cactorum]